MNTSTTQYHHQQQGVALVVALILLVVVTLVGLAAIRGTTMQQQMTNNFYDRELSFQSAEAALRTGETWITNPANQKDALVRDCTIAGTDCWSDPYDQGSTINGFIQNVTTGNFDAGALGVGQPQYMVEYLGQCNQTSGNFQFTNDQNNQGGGGSLVGANICFRITARSNPNAAANDRSQVILQTIMRL